METNKDIRPEKLTKPQQDRAYREMLKPVIEWLSGKDVKELAELSGGTAAEDESGIFIRTLNEKVKVCLPDCSFEPEVENWQSLVLLHYLNNAKGAYPTGEWISFEAMKDGLIRGTKFVRSSSEWFQRFLRGKTLEEVRAVCMELGGKEIEGRGDYSCILPFLPYFPVLLNIWEADEDFEATGKMLVDKTADYYLSIEDAVTAGEIIHNRLERTWQALFTEKRNIK